MITAEKTRWKGHPATPPLADRGKSVRNSGRATGRLASARAAWLQHVISTELWATPSSTRLCRRKRIAADVQLAAIRRRDGSGQRLGIHGVHTCGFALCALCAPALMARRAREVQQALGQHDPRASFFVTLTARHNRGQPLRLQRRLLTNAYSLLYSGRPGDDFAQLLGGPETAPQPPRGLPNLPVRPRTQTRRVRVTDGECVYEHEEEELLWRHQPPFSVRAHDTTWSAEKGFHPHLHAIVFLHRAMPEGELRYHLWARWSQCLELALRQMKDVVSRAARTGLPYGSRRRLEETASLRTRCEKLLSQKLFRRRDSLAASARRVQKHLDAIDLNDIAPTFEHGVHVECVRSRDRAAEYLGKLGLELSGAFTRDPKTVVERSGRRVTHYSPWQLTEIVGTHGHPIRDAARRAANELVDTSRGQQALVWSKGARKHFGIDVRLDADVEQEDADTAIEEQQFLGRIPGAVWDARSRELRHLWVAELREAFASGTLHELVPELTIDGVAVGALSYTPIERRQKRAPPVPVDVRGPHTSRAPPESAYEPSTVDASFGAFVGHWSVFVDRYLSDYDARENAVEWEVDRERALAVWGSLDTAREVLYPIWHRQRSRGRKKRIGAFVFDLRGRQEALRAEARKTLVALGVVLE